MTNKEKISVRIPKEMNAKLTAYLKPIGITKNAFILSLIREAIENKGGGGGGETVFLLE